MEIQPLTRNGEGDWDDYITRSPKATFFHQLGWKRVVERTYGLEPAYLTAAEGGDGHCEPKSAVVRDQRVFDWLDNTLGEP